MTVFRYLPFTRPMLYLGKAQIVGYPGRASLVRREILDLCHDSAFACSSRLMGYSEWGGDIIERSAYSFMPLIPGHWQVDDQMETDGRFRRYAAAARRNARRAKSHDERVSWLWLAEGWLGLLRKRPRTDKKDIKGRAYSEKLH